MSDDDISLDEKRVYADRTGTTTAFVATGLGLARVEISDDIVGEFALEHKGSATDVAVVDGQIAVATDDDVLVRADGAFEETGFGPAAAVGAADGLVAAGDGRVARYEDGTWRTLCDLAGVRAIEGDLVAAESGVHRIDGTHVGLTAANDVATGAAPMAATDDGLYYLANGWMKALDGRFEVVAAGPDGIAYASTDAAFYERDPDGGERREAALPVDERVVAVSYGPGTYVLTEAGTLLANAGDGWRRRLLGLPDATAMVVLPPRDDA